MLILRTPRKKRISKWEALLARQIAHAQLPEPVREYRFDIERKWRFDFAWLAEGFAVEVEGAVFAGGRHTRGSGFMADLEKYNTALLLGWRVLRVTPAQVKDGTAVTMIRLALGR